LGKAKTEDEKLRVIQHLMDRYKHEYPRAQDEDATTYTKKAIDHITLETKTMVEHEASTRKRFAQLEEEVAKPRRAASEIAIATIDARHAEENKKLALASELVVTEARVHLPTCLLQLIGEYYVSDAELVHQKVQKQNTSALTRAYETAPVESQKEVRVAWERSMIRYETSRLLQKYGITF
jgi:hypothetical protein